MENIGIHRYAMAILVYFASVGYILWPFGLFYISWVYRLRREKAGLVVRMETFIHSTFIFKDRKKYFLQKLFAHSLAILG
jgi:hypothetical protein